MRNLSPHQAIAQRQKNLIAQRASTGFNGVTTDSPNRTGLPDALKSGIESLSGMGMDDVRVHTNSSKPAEFNALAYAQGTDIHLGPGQERHLPHEAWHIVQQKRGQVQATGQMKGQAINDNVGLEKEADHMAEKAQRNSDVSSPSTRQERSFSSSQSNAPIQRALATINNINPRNLGAHYTTIVGGEAEGRGAATSSGTNLKTKITWDPVDADTGEGTGMEANPLGPDHPLGSPTSGNTGISTRTKNFNDAFAGSWRQGHLLNANLGGPGDEPRNLVAISQSTNSSMSSNIENMLQQRINENGEWMHFKADVTHAQITDQESKTAAKKEGLGNPAYWARKLEFSWGPLDKYGNKTGRTEYLTLRTGEPVTREYNPRKTEKDEEYHTHTNQRSQAKTTIGEEDVVLDSVENIAYQVENKVRARSERYDEQLLTELSAPPTPYRMQTYVDDEITKDYSTHKPLKDFRGSGRELNYYRENRKIRNTDPYYLRDFGSYVERAKREQQRNYPLKLANKLKDNATHKDIDTALSLAKLQFDSLGTKVEGTRGFLNLIPPKDYAFLLDEFYQMAPIAFKDYYEALETNLI